MSKRIVTQSRKDDDGDIVALCNPDPSQSWSPRTIAEVIEDIEDDVHSYYARRHSNGEESEIVVVKGASGKYLRTVQDDHTENNLDELPDC